MTSDLTPRNRALAALKVVFVGLALANAPGPASAEVTADPAEATVFLRFACLEKVKQAPPHVDRALFVPEKRVGWGSGVFVREDGLLVTTDHSLADLTKDEPADVAGETITVGCDREDITVDVFELDSITQALRGEQGKYRELADLRDASLADRDVLFLQADTRGHDVPWLCAPATIALEEYKDMPITAAGVDNDLGQPEYVPREGKAISKWGAGEASKYLEMTPAAEKGMSGGPVVRRSDGALVGIVHGNRPSSNPLATVNYFVPLTKFGGHLSQYVDPCAPKVVSSFEEPKVVSSFEELLVLFDPKGAIYIAEISNSKFRPVIDGTRNFLRSVFGGTANVVVGNRSYLKAALSDPDYLIDAWADEERAHDLIKPGGKRAGILVKMIDQETTVDLLPVLFSVPDEARSLVSVAWRLDNARPGLTPDEHTEQFGHHLVRELERAGLVALDPAISALVRLPEAGTPLGGPALATEHSAGAGSNVHNQVRPALVALRAVGRNDQGQEKVAFGTGFIVHPDGFVLTAHHLRDELGKVVGDVKYDGIIRATHGIEWPLGEAAGAPGTDLLLLKLPDRGEVYPYLIVGSVANIEGARLYTSGFFGACQDPNPPCLQSVRSYTTDDGEFRSRDTPRPFLWGTDLTINEGQSGSPVYLADGQVVGVATGSQALPGAVGVHYFVPSSYAEPILRSLPSWSELQSGKPDARGE